MEEIIISEKEYLDKAYACWLGKCIGGTLGRPLEGKRGPHRLTFYRPIPHRPIENDDLDIQLVWLHALRERGVNITSQELAQEWLDHIIYWFDEYRFATANLKKGLVPPISGSFNNWYKDCMRSPIRSEIWALISPGSPQTAVRYAYQDATIDHTDEGVYGEVFLAAIESAAFLVSDVQKLLELGLSVIPPECRVSKAVRDVMQWHREKAYGEEARRRLLDKHGSDNFSDTPQNLGIVTLGLLYGDGDFEKGILAAVNCGLDSDCNAGTAGSILGIIGGRDGIPVKWQSPIKGKIAPGRGIVGFEPPTEIETLAQQSLALAKAVLEKNDAGVRITTTKHKGRRAAAGDFGELSPVTLSDHDRFTEEHPIGAATLKIRYQDSPTINYDKPAEIEFTIANTSEKGIEGHVEVAAPWGWQFEPASGFDFSIKKKAGSSSTKLTLRADEKSVQILPINPLSARINTKGQQPVTVQFALAGERRWLVAGPYGKKGKRAHERVYMPEKALADTKPRGQVTFKKASFPEFSMNINPLFGHKKEGAVYAFGWFYSSRKRDLRLFVSCNDGVKVWLNDRLALARHNHFPIRPPGYRADVQVQRGWNRLLLKVSRCGNPVNLHLYFGDQKNHVFNDVIDTYFPPEVLAFAG